MSAALAVQVISSGYDIWQAGKTYRIQSKVAAAAHGARQAQIKAQEAAFNLASEEERLERFRQFESQVAAVNNSLRGGTAQTDIQLDAAATAANERERKISRQTKITALNFRTAGLDAKAQFFASKGQIAGGYRASLFKSVADLGIAAAKAYDASKFTATPVSEGTFGESTGPHPPL